jgi:hypothetical protein
MVPVPASRSRDRGRRPGAIPWRARAFPIVAGACLLAAGVALTAQIVPEARAFRALAKGTDVHGTPVACRIAPLTRNAGEAVLTLRYLTPAGPLLMDAPTRHADCGEALAEPRDHRVLYAPGNPALAAELDQMPMRRYRLIGTSAGALALLLAGFGCIGWALTRR